MTPQSRRQRIRLVKRFTFEMAHALDGYDGPCRNIHGHTYHLQVTVSGKPITDPKSPKLGMVMDFGDLKKIVRSQILDVFDHALVLNNRSPMAEIEELSVHFGKALFVPWQPTCENLVVEFQRRISAHLPEEVRLQNLILSETPSSTAEWHYDDNL